MNNGLFFLADSVFRLFGTQILKYLRDLTHFQHHNSHDIGASI